MKTRACTRTVINIYDFLIYSENRTSHATATTDLSTLIFVHTVFLASFPPAKRFNLYEFEPQARCDYKRRVRARQRR